MAREILRLLRDIRMKYYSLKRIVWSIVVSVWMPIIVGGLYGSATRQGKEELFLPFLIAGIALLGILLPKIWWNFILDRIREIVKTIKDPD